MTGEYYGFSMYTRAQPVTSKLPGPVKARAGLGSIDWPQRRTPGGARRSGREKGDFGYFAGRDFIKIGAVFTIVQGVLLLLVVLLYWPWIALT